MEAVMQRARAFFYVCAGIFLLALAYQLGASGATAQAMTVIRGPEFGQGSAFGGVAFVLDRTFYHGSVGGPGDPVTISPVAPPVPGVAAVVAVRDVGPGAAAV